MAAAAGALASPAVPVLPTPPTAAPCRAADRGASMRQASLSRFVPDEGRGWLHVDLAACFQRNGDSLYQAPNNTLGMRTHRPYPDGGDALSR